MRRKTLVRTRSTRTSPWCSERQTFPTYHTVDKPTTFVVFFRNGECDCDRMTNTRHVTATAAFPPRSSQNHSLTCSLLLFLDNHVQYHQLVLGHPRAARYTPPPSTSATLTQSITSPSQGCCTRTLKSSSLVWIMPERLSVASALIPPQDI